MRLATTTLRSERGLAPTPITAGRGVFSPPPKEPTFLADRAVEPPGRFRAGPRPPHGRSTADADMHRGTPTRHTHATRRGQ